MTENIKEDLDIKEFKIKGEITPPEGEEGDACNDHKQEEEGDLMKNTEIKGNFPLIDGMPNIKRLSTNENISLIQ